MSTEIPQEWYFITPPQSVSWSKDSRTSMIEPYGTNNPYVHYGTTKLRSLSLGDSLVEGFSDGKVVEENIVNLEACMRMVLDSENGFAAPYCWHVYAGGKSYGTYIITGVNVDEQIRDVGGLAARAKVDISLQEVSPYQVSSGIDVTAEAISGKLTPEAQKELEKINKDKDTKENQEDAVKKKNDVDGKNKENGGGGGDGGGGDPDPADTSNNAINPNPGFVTEGLN